MPGPSHWRDAPNAVVRDSVRGEPLALPLPSDALYAGGTRWFVENESLVVDGRPLVKFGLPRPLAAGAARRIGTVHGVGVYVEAGTRGRPEVVYLPVSAEGGFQPYENTVGTGCP